MFDRKHLNLTWGGSIGTADGQTEVWQCGLHLADSNAVIDPTVPTLAELTTLFADEIVPFHEHADTGISKGATLTWARIALVNTAGVETVEATIYESGSAHYGGSGTTLAGAPPQTSVAVTLWSGSTFGRANYGRFYLPWMTSLVKTTTGQMETGVALQICNKASLFLSGVNLWAKEVNTATTAVSNMSQVGTGTTKEVTTVRIGSVVDTQRRRRNRLSESYTDSLL